ncbi:protein-disulfide reductase DsbD family protein [Chlamydiales bacterium]|nr:protein-disulfide reductase DsbD family protein [Chlamydiales bacterium]
MKKLLLSVLVFFSFLLPQLGECNEEFLKEENVEVVENTKPVYVKVLTAVETIADGVPFWVALEVNIKEGWKVYWKNPGESGFPVTVEWVLPEGFTVGELEYPTPMRAVINDFVVFGYDRPFTLLAQITPPKKLPETVEIEADVSWVACDVEACVPGNTPLHFTLKGGDSTEMNDEVESKIDQLVKSLPQKTDEIKIEEVTPEAFLLFIPKEIYPHEADEALFFPEDSDGIDLKKQVTTVPQPQGTGTFVTVKRHETNKPNELLKGVLVLKTNLPKEGTSYEVSIQISPRAPEARTSPMPIIFQEGKDSYLLILLFAFIGGVILNLMPCVLPIISIKVLSFVQMAGESRKKTMLHGVLFALGVLVSFWVLAGILLLLRAWGHSVGWGFQLQDPTFIAVLAGVLLILTLWLFGLFELGFKVASSAGDALHKVKGKESSKIGSFFSGVLATAVATPCSGPFLGTALGVALTLPPMASLLIFTFLGLGMSFPYLLFAAFPSLLRFLPRPGPWMDTFKQFMGFLMLLSVLWLVWVFVAQTNSQETMQLFIGLFTISFAGWIYGRFAHPMKKRFPRRVASVIALSLVIWGFWTVIDAGQRGNALDNQGSSQAMSDDGWKSFTPELMDQLKAEGKPIFVDFTAKWCLLCQSNLLVINTSSVQERMEELGVQKVMADWTRPDPAITKELARFGRSSVPLYIYYPEGVDSKPEILPQVLTPDIILEFLEPTP